MPKSVSPLEGPASPSATAIRLALDQDLGLAHVTRARSPAQAAYLDLMRTHPLVFGIGPAGTGKTYLAAAFGAHLLHERRVERLILSRPALEAGERLGFLPGDLKEKIDPYLRPLYDALFDVLGEQCTEADGAWARSRSRRSPSCAGARWRAPSSSSTRRRTCTPAQMKMFLTRLGEDSRMVVTGDPSQSDLPGGRAEGLERGACASSHGVEGAAVARFGEKDVVRHALVTRIVAAYNAADAQKASSRDLAPAEGCSVSDPRW